LLSQARYYEIIGVWEERSRLEKSLKDELQNLKNEKTKWLSEKKELKKLQKRAIQEAVRKGINKEKGRADKLSRMIQSKTQDIQNLNKKVKELQDQLKRGTTPQIEGLNLEAELVKELQREFPQDSVEHHGKSGDILHRVLLNKKQVGSILYECKKTSKFSNAYVEQTKKALADRQASYGVLVTTAFKKDTAGFYVQNDILVVHPYGAIYIARVLRSSIIDLHSQKLKAPEMDKRTKQLMGYIKSDDFKNSVGDSIHRTRSLYQMLEKEMKGHKSVWENRFTHYQKIHDNLGRMETITGSILKGIPTKEALESLKQKQLPPIAY
jgi:hypothetical protein